MTTTIIIAAIAACVFFIAGTLFGVWIGTDVDEETF
jgi:hypothetical protein